MNIPFEGTLFAMQQPEAAVGQTALRGNPASQMTSRNQKFETLGEAVMDALKDGTAADGLIKTDLVFASEEEVFSFGRYYYRYIYLGKEEVTLYSSDEMGSMPSTFPVRIRTGRCRNTGRCRTGSLMW